MYFNKNSLLWIIFMNKLACCEKTASNYLKPQSQHVTIMQNTKGMPILANSPALPYGFIEALEVQLHFKVTKGAVKCLQWESSLGTQIGSRLVAKQEPVVPQASQKIVWGAITK